MGFNILHIVAHTTIYIKSTLYLVVPIGNNSFNIQVDYLMDIKRLSSVLVSNSFKHSQYVHNVFNACERMNTIEELNKNKNKK